MSIGLLLALVFGGWAVMANIRSNRVVVPLVSGLTLERAKQVLGDAGLQLGEISTLETNAHPPDAVLGQAPAGQVVVRRSSAIALTVAAPKAVDLARFVEIRNIDDATIAAAAVATAMGTSLAVQGRPMRLSMRYLYAKAKRHDETAGDGTFMETMIYVARQFGAPPETLWPDQSSQERPPAGNTWNALDTAAARYKADVDEIPDMDAVLASLDAGRPVVVAVTVTDAWSSDDAMKTGVIAATGRPDALADGTGVITIVGYDPAARCCWSPSACPR